MNFFGKKHNKQRSQIINKSLVTKSKLITAIDSKHYISEQFRNIRTNINFVAAAGQKVRTLMVSSPNMSEGKSTTSSNLSVIYAQQGERVLLIDADLRRPTIEKVFGLEKGKSGLTNYLANNSLGAENCIQETDTHNLFIMPAGVIPPNPSQLLESDRMKNLVKEVEQMFDIVIFDVPPLLSVTDAQLLMPLIDGIIVVVSLGKTSKASMKRSMEILEISKISVLGIVYNDLTKNRKQKGYDYGYDYSR